MDNLVSIATENFIKVIYKFEQGEGWDTRPGSIAKELGITNAAATDMARKLATKKLIDYEKYKKLKLTASGKRMALSIIRKHRLWETFLHQVFGLSLHEIHREAEVLEHLTSDFLTEKINHYLGNPRLDPHGDPIPDELGIIPDDKSSIILSVAKSGEKYEISRISGSEKEFFDFCHSNNLIVGSVILLMKQYSRTGMTEIEVNKTKVLLNREMSNTIYVKKLKRTKNIKSGI